MYGTVDVDKRGRAGTTYRHLPGLPHHIDKLAPAGQASGLFCQDILQHGLVQAQIGDQALQLAILFLELT